ncbi:MAG: hypothetical protein J0G28_15660 [Afipia sp.]|nr:hypothetical protein [Afipia sp.]
MTIREALKADFGIDVLIRGGSGRIADPFVIEPCSSRYATRTQLNLLRGLGRGRQELWRLLESEAVPEVVSTIQKLRIETVAFTQDQIVSEVRSLYFDVSHVDGTPDASAPLIEWSDPRIAFCAPSQIGWLHFDGTIDNSQGDAILDTSLLYSALGAKAAIYIYGAADGRMEGASSSEIRERELQLVCNQVLAAHPDAKTPWPVHVAEPFVLQHFLIGEDMSIAGIAMLGSHCLKLRLTYSDDLKMRELMLNTIAELAKLISQKLQSSVSGQLRP